MQSKEFVLAIRHQVFLSPNLDMVQLAIASGAVFVAQDIDLIALQRGLNKP